MTRPLRIAVIGSGISGLSAAWLLARHHDVTLFEKDGRLGGHSNTVDVPTSQGSVPVDTGFIVFNEATYPNLTAMLAHLGVPSAASDMSFAVSIDDGRLEYAATDLRGLFAQPRNIVSPRFWSMLSDLVRFYREAPSHAGKLGLTTLGDFLASRRYGRAFRDDHLMPMAAAIWSAPAATLLDFPAESFIRFCQNHGLLNLVRRPIWRTVEGGSRAYVAALARGLEGRVRLNAGLAGVTRDAGGVTVHGADGGHERFDRLVLATHADQALALLSDADPEEARRLSAFRYTRNLAVLHTDEALMPARRQVWASWNYLGGRHHAEDAAPLCVTYWMNRLQPLATDRNIFVTLNPSRPVAKGCLIRTETYEHPVFDAAALTAQRSFWEIQGRSDTWFCGAYLGSGFHEDGLQAGLAVAEAIGGVRRPWSVPDESGRITLLPPADLAEAA